MKNGVRTALLLLGDVIVLVASFFIMVGIAFYGTLTSKIFELHLLPFTILGIFWLFIFFIFNLYEIQKSKPTIPNLRQIMMAFLVAIVISVIFFYTIQFFNITPKTNLLIFSISAMILFIIWRRIFYRVFASYFQREVIFLIKDEKNMLEVEELRKYMKDHPQSGFVVSKIYNTMESFLGEQKKVPQILIVGNKIWNNALNFRILQNYPADVLDLAQAYEDILGRIPLGAIDEGWLMHNLSQKGEIYNYLEKIFAAIVAALILFLTSPFLLLTTIAIKLNDGGDVFYSQERVGIYGKIFKLYKFRSMIMDAEKEGAKWSSKKDDRVTKVGRIIRVIHFDEIPQMWNVIRGDITLVGPRPERPEFVKELESEIPFYYLRHSISPGFTGWAQIKFRYAGSVIDSKEKFEYDLYYLKSRNIFMDLGILARTIQIIFTH